MDDDKATSDAGAEEEQPKEEPQVVEELGADTPSEEEAYQRQAVHDFLGGGEEQWDVPERQKVQDMPTATVADIRRMKGAREAMAQPFPLESIGMKVLVAPCDFRTYNKLMSYLFEQNVEEKGDMTAKSHAALIVSCIVEPKLSDEDVAAFEEAVGTDILRLVGFCRKLSKTNESASLILQGVDLAEDFTKGTH